jgi:hypothetical protein
MNGTVLDKNMNTLFYGTGMQIVDWVIKNPVEPSYVILDEAQVLITLDDYLEFWDLEHDL